ncbi:MAG: 16S rRNA (cytosine(967)-C(5))-methyltransferase RsmB [Ruminococcaceae bacterium]|nr:16S rRNA (cytosine(967)-C(5))-methyltransferase RsmB [Oscillospiraceae bacterium]
MQNARNIALNVLYNIDVNGAYINIELKNSLEKSNLSSVDRNFVTELVHGVIRYKIRLDYVIKQFSKIKWNKISPYVVNILRLGIYQILFLDKIPNSAAINESVNLVKKYSNHSSGFVNALLRNVTRNEIKYPEEQIEYLSVFYSFENWMVKKFVDDYGYEKTVSILNSLNRRKNLYIRVNTLVTDVDSLIKEFEDKSIIAKKSDIISDALSVKGIGNLNTLDAFVEGKFYVQNLSSMLCVKSLDVKENNLVIDVCAAPGGKTSYISQIMNNTGKIIAFDMYEHKIKLMNENFERLHIKNIDVELNNSENVCEKYVEKADCVLVDAPCSGLGIISQKPDIKYSIKEEDIQKLSKQSLKILNTSAKYVKKGGTLVFSLCTFTNEESVHNVEKFLELNNDFKLEKINCYDEDNNGMITIFPDETDMDGFFICKFKRV